MASIETICNGARAYMRDHPRFFSATVSKMGPTTTFKLGKKNILAVDFQAVAVVDGTSYRGYPVTTNITNSQMKFFIYAIDQRNGLVRIERWTDGVDLTEANFYFEGYFCEWVNDGDLRYFANNVVAEVAYRDTDFSLETVPDAVEDAMSLGVAVEAFWSILSEAARDIDINTPEGVAIPATQRFHQIEGLLSGPDGLIEKYKTKCNMLGVGIEKIEMFTLRRVSRTTNRLVPVYKQREWDDVHPPVRLFPEITREAPSTPPASFVPAAQVTSFFDGSGTAPNA